jgi:alpha-L-fucosidase 2
MAIHPLGLITVDGGPHDRAVLAASLSDLQRLGTSAWCGYSFSWTACLAARAGQPETAGKYLDLFVKAFVSRNGFHLNGDFKRLGHSSFTYRPFTLEGNFAAAAAVHEMLLQSWGDRVRVFPAAPNSWRDAQFEDLRAEGGYTVSATRRGGETTMVTVQAADDGVLRLRNPFGDRQPQWNRRDVHRLEDDYVVRLRRGEKLSGRI